MLFNYRSRSGKVLSIEYNPDETTFAVEIGRGKGKYKSRYTFLGNDLQRAAMYYSAINIGNGYKKRFKVGNKVVARCFSS